MRIFLAISLTMLFSGCSVSPFGLAPWVIVMPGAKLNVVVGSKSEDHRVVGESKVEDNTSVVKEDKKKGFVPPDMSK